jgi:hypothetical protein
MYTLKDAFKMPLVGEVKQMMESKPDGIIGSYRPFDVMNTYQRDKKNCEAMKLYTDMHSKKEINDQ